MNMPEPPIDRRALVDRHRVIQRDADPRSPLSVGNGEFCFTADLTGVQTFPAAYPVESHGQNTMAGTLLGTYAQWGWHIEPANPAPSLAETLVSYPTPRGPVEYVDMATSIDGATRDGALWLRGNPHRLHLGLLGFAEHTGQRLSDLQQYDIEQTEQTLDLWSGLLTSRFRWRHHPATVRTVCDPELDRLAVQLDSPGLTSGLALRMSFPYGNQDWHNGADWHRPDDHRTTVCVLGDRRWLVDRILDSTHYRVLITGSPGATVEMVGRHQLMITASSDHVELVIDFLNGDQGLEDRMLSNEPAGDASTVVERAAAGSAQFWSNGAAVDLSAVDETRAAELERRIVLSQYLTRINCSGSLPPAETGLVCNSWSGKFHLEMHWWHAAHFPLWGRPELLRRSLSWYAAALPVARETAARQGFSGVRWPKHIGPDAVESPSPIGPFIIWQQPHPIYLAELIYRTEPSRAVLDDLAEVVLETASFMTDYAYEIDGSYRLGPPLVPAQESYGQMRAHVADPTFELVYWHWALQIANQWRVRLGIPADKQVQRVADNLVAPTVRDGVYAAIGVEPWTIRTDHPSMLCALGMLPQTTMIDTATMSATLDNVLADWDWSSTWGWDYPVIAMCAARLGRPEQAVDALLATESKNIMLANGHNRQTASLPLYLPGNGGLLAAIALMAGGWENGPQRAAPGFPSSWRVRAEGFVRAP